MKSVLTLITRTSGDWAPLIARLTLAVVFFPHGSQKVLGWFGGYGFTGTMGFFTTQMGMPAIVAFLILLAEFGGSIGLIFGFLSRLSAFGIIMIMLGAIFMVHLQNGFFMNWFGGQKGEGFEYHILAITLALPILIRGGGAFSIDG